MTVMASATTRLVIRGEQRNSTLVAGRRSSQLISRPSLVNAHDLRPSKSCIIYRSSVTKEKNQNYVLVRWHPVTEDVDGGIMPEFTQAGRALRIDTPLGEDAVLLRSVSGQESVSQLFRFQLELLSENEQISFDSIVGKNVTIHVESVDSERTFNGFISRFSQGAQDGRFTYYPRRDGPVAVVPDPHGGLPYFSTQDRTADYPENLRGFGISRFQAAAVRHLPAARLLRAVPGNRLQLCIPADGRGKASAISSSMTAVKHELILGDDPASHEPCPSQARPAVISLPAGGGARMLSPSGAWTGVSPERLGSDGLQF